MTCPARLTCAMYADGALARSEAAALASHLDGCAVCRDRVAALSAERRAIHSALLGAETRSAIPALIMPPTIGALVTWLGWLALAGWGVSVAWQSLATAELPVWLHWLVPDMLGAGIQVVLGGLLHLLLGGDGPVAALLEVFGALLLTTALLTVIWLLARRRPRAAGPTCLTLGLALALLTVAPSSHAFEVRRDEVRVTVGPDETIDDTLIVMAESVLVEGTVTGDVIAMGERVSIRGAVGGTVLALGNVVELAGTVEGSVLAGAETVTVRDAELNGNAYAMGRVVDVGADTRVAGNGLLMAAEAQFHGSVGRDLLALARSLTVLGAIDGTLTSYAEQVDVEASARIGGDLVARVAQSDNLNVDAGATIGGDTRVTTSPEEPSRYATWHYYLGELLQLLAAFVCGLVLFHLFPGLARGRLDDGAQVLTTAAIGALGLIAVPALAVACIITLIGAPVGIAVLLLWLLGLYLAGIVVAGLVGRRLLNGATTRPVVSLLLGLGIVYVLINVPFVGDLVRFVVLLMGLGLIGHWLRGLWGPRAAA